MAREQCKQVHFMLPASGAIGRRIALGGIRICAVSEVQHSPPAVLPAQGKISE